MGWNNCKHRWKVDPIQGYPEIYKWHTCVKCGENKKVKTKKTKKK